MRFESIGLAIFITLGGLSLVSGCGGVISGGERSGQQGEDSTAEGDDDGFTKSVESVPIAGTNLVGIDNFINVCGKEQAADGIIEATCIAAVKDRDGVPRPADGFKPGVRGRWHTPVTRTGSVSSVCERSKDGLTFVCKFTSKSNARDAQVAIGLEIEERKRQRTENVLMTLEFSIYVAAGLVPNISYSFIPPEGPAGATKDDKTATSKPAAGHVPTAFGIPQEFHSSTAACGDFFKEDKRAFFAWNKYTFEKLNKGSSNRAAINWDGTKDMVVHYAGSTKTGATNDFTDRRRTALGNVSFGMLCEAGHVLVSDFGNNRILKFKDNGAVDVVEKTIQGPRDLQKDADGNLYVLSSDKKIYRIAPNGLKQVWVDASVLHYPSSFFREDDGSFLIADQIGNRVVRTGLDGNGAPVTEVIAGNCSGENDATKGGSTCAIGDKPTSGASATGQAVAHPTGVTKDKNGRIYISLFYRGLYYLTSDGNIVNVPGETSGWTYVDGEDDSVIDGIPKSDDLAKYAPYNFVDRDADGYVLFDTKTGINRLKTDGTNQVVVGPSVGNEQSDGCNHDVAGHEKRFVFIGSMALDQNNGLLLTDRLGFGNSSVESLGIFSVAQKGRSSTVATMHGCGRSDQLKVPTTLDFSAGLAVLSNGDYIVANPNRHIVVRIDKVTGDETVIAGEDSSDNSTAGNVDGTLGASRLNTPTDVAVDASGNVYVADYGNKAIRVISNLDATPTTTTLATDGGGSVGTPEALDVNADGTRIVIADAGNYIRLWTPARGGRTTVIGGNGVAGYNASDDGGPAIGAGIDRPRSVKFSYNVNSSSDDVVFVQFDAGSGAVMRKLLNNGSDVFSIATKFGNGTNVDCGANYIKAKVGDLGASLDEFCAGKVTSVTVDDAACRKDARSSRTTYIANSFAETSNVLAVKVPCKID